MVKMANNKMFRLACSLLVGLVVFGLGHGVALGQSATMQETIASDVAGQGYWDESSILDPTLMGQVVDQFGGVIAFAYTDRNFETQDPNQSAAALLALSTLEQIELDEGPRTLLFVTGDDASGASNEFPFANISLALSDFDRSNPEASFAEAAEQIVSLGDVIDSSLLAQVDPIAQSDQGFFSGSGPFIILGIVTAILAGLSYLSAQKKRNRRTHTQPAKSSTAMELQEMSDLILDLDPRVTIENNADLKARFVEASDTYRDVLEKSQTATTGQEIADLRIDIAKARWKLDVIDAEIEGRTPPKEPFTRDNSGSAWDSTRGDGPQR